MQNYKFIKQIFVFFVDKKTYFLKISIFAAF